MKKRINKSKRNHDRVKYISYLNSKKWKQIRRNALDWFGNQCCKCGNKHNLEIHHITYKNLYKETMADLLCLCSRCHWLEHRFKVQAKNKSKSIDETVTYYPNRKRK